MLNRFHILIWYLEVDDFAKRIFLLVIQVQQLKHFASKSLTQLFYNIPILQLHCALKFMLFFSGDDFTYCTISHALHAYHLIYLFCQFLRLCNKTFFFPVDADVFFQAWSSLCSDLFLEKNFSAMFYSSISITFLSVDAIVSFCEFRSILLQQIYCKRLPSHCSRAGLL